MLQSLYTMLPLLYGHEKQWEMSKHTEKKKEHSVAGNEKVYLLDQQQKDLSSLDSKVVL